MLYFDIELIDVNENIENFKYSKVSQKDLDKIKEYFKSSGLLGQHSFFEFSFEDGEVILRSCDFRGLVYTKYQEKQKTAIQESKESAIEIQKIKVSKTEGEQKHD